jgi:hypothetical protein
MSSGAAKPLTFAFPPSKPAGYEVWGLRMPTSWAQAVADLPQIDLTETAIAPDGRRLAHPEKLSTEGLSASLASLLATCPPPRETAAVPQAMPQNSAAK